MVACSFRALADFRDGEFERAKLFSSPVWTRKSGKSTKVVFREPAQHKSRPWEVRGETNGSHRNPFTERCAASCSAPLTHAPTLA